MSYKTNSYFKIVYQGDDENMPFEVYMKNPSEQLDGSVCLKEKTHYDVIHETLDCSLERLSGEVMTISVGKNTLLSLFLLSKDDLSLVPFHLRNYLFDYNKKVKLLFNEEPLVKTVERMEQVKISSRIRNIFNGHDGKLRCQDIINIPEVTDLHYSLNTVNGYLMNFKESQIGLHEFLDCVMGEIERDVSLTQEGFDTDADGVESVFDIKFLDSILIIDWYIIHRTKVRMSIPDMTSPYFVVPNTTVEKI